MACSKRKVVGSKTEMWTDSQGLPLSYPQLAVVMREATYEEYIQSLPEDSWTLRLSESFIREHRPYYYEVSTD